MDSPKGVSPRSGVSEKNRQPPVYHHPFEMFLNSFSSVIDDITENIRIRINSIIDPLADSIIHFFDQKWNFIWRSMKVSNADKKFVDELSIADEVHNGLEQTINTSESPSLISVSASVASTTLPMASATRKKGKTKGGTSSVFNTTGKTASVGNHSRGLSVSDHNSATTGLTDTLEKVYTSTPPAILPDGNKSLHAVSSTNSIAESDESAPVVAFKSPDRDNLAETHLYTAFSSLDEYENQNETDSFTVISKKATKGKKGVVSNTGAGFAKAVGKEIVESSTNNQNSLPLTKTTSVAGPISSSSVPNPVAFAIIPPTTSRSKHTLVHSESTASHQHSSSISDEMSSTDTHARVTSNTKPSINAWQQPLAQKMKVVSSLGGPSNILGSNLLDNNLTAADITKYGDTSISSSISTTKQHNVVVDSPAKSAAPRNDQRVTMPHSISSDTVDNADLDLNTINFEEMGPGDDDLQGIVNSILPPGYRGIGQQWLDSEIGLVPRPSVIHARNGGLMNNLPNGQLGLPSSLLQSPDIGMGPLKQYNGSLATSVNLTTGQLSVESRSQSLSVGGSKSIPYQRKALQQSGPSMTIPPNNNSYSFSQPRFLSQQLNEASPAPLSMNEHYFGQNEYPNGVISQVNGLTDDFDMSEMTPQGATLSASAPSFSPGNLAYFGTQSPQFTNASAFPGGLYDTSSRHPSSVFDLTPIGPPTAASIPFLSLGRSVYAQQSSLGGGMPLLSSQGITQSPPAYDSHSATSSAMHLMGSTMSNNMHPINDISHEFLAVDVTSVTLIIMVKVALESQDNIVLVKVTFSLLLT